MADSVPKDYRLSEISLEALQASFAGRGRLDPRNWPRSGVAGRKGRIGHPPMPEAEYLQWWLERVASKTIKDQNGCWIWTGHVQSKGYGNTTWTGGKPVRVHRRIFEITTGLQLSPDQLVCHTCDVRRCWNPTHLFLGTVTDNNRDMLAKGRNYWANVTHCRHGHEFTPENTYVYAAEPNKRKCKACAKARSETESYANRRREYQREYRAKKRAATQEVSTP